MRAFKFCVFTVDNEGKCNSDITRLENLLVKNSNPGSIEYSLAWFRSQGGVVTDQQGIGPITIDDAAIEGW